jgi:5-methylcytosine-specific restriction endonuclease McrA
LSRAAYRREYRQRVALHPDFNRQIDLRRKYGLSLEDFNAMLAAQGGVCAVCGTDDPKGRHDTFAVDHDHETDEVRGLLCNPCNLALGIAEDDPQRLRAMADYLERNS